MLTKTRTEDLADAARVLRTARALRPLITVNGRSWRTRAMREAIKVAWEEPRIAAEADGNRGGTHPSSLPWSPMAKRWARTRSPEELSGQLVREHVAEIGLVSNHLMDHAATLRKADVADLLRVHLAHAIVTVDEDSLLRAGDVFLRELVKEGVILAIDPEDLWRRYKVAFLPFDEFSPRE